MSASLIPAAKDVVSEAKSTKFQISMLLLIGLCAGAYWAGRESGRGISRAEVEAIQANNRLEIDAVKKACSDAITVQRSNASVLVTIDGRQQAQNSQLEVIRSKLDDINRRH